MPGNRNRQIQKQLRSMPERAATPDVADGYELIAKARHESEKKFRSLVQYIPDVIWTTDKDQRIIFVSQNIKAITGYAPEEEYEMGQWISWFDRIHPDDVERYRIAYNELLKKKKPFNVMYRFKRRDGQWIWVYDRAIAVYEKDGMKYAHGLLTEITEHKQAEAEIEKLKEKYESVIRNIPDAIYSGLPDETCSMAFISDRYKDWTGYFPQDFYKDPGLWPKTVCPEDRAKAVGTYIEAWERKEAYLSEYRVVHKDTGQVRWVRDHGVPVKDEKGNVIMYDGIITDITERKQAEQALAESEEFSSGLLENSPNPIVVINSDTSIRYVNPALMRMTGFTGRELLGTKPPYPWWMEETLQKAMRERMRGIEQLFQRKDGGQFWVEVSSTPVMANRQFKYLLVSWIDVSEQRRLREDLQHYIREVTMAQEQERKRISRELHDETVQSLADLCTDVDVIIMKTKLSEKVNQQLKQHRLKIQGVMDEVRRFSHELRPTLLDYFGLIRSLESLAQEWKSEGKLNFHVDVIGSEQRLSSEAELLLFRITQEALRNVRKHSNATEAVVRVEFAKKQVKLNVTDNGSGFEVPKKLGSFTRRGKLGLVGMKERAHLLGGSFRLQSSLGKGTMITVEIPVDANYGVM